MLLTLMVLAGCSSQDPTAESLGCGLPSPNPNRNPRAIPKGYIPEEGTLVDAQEERGGFLASINVKLGVQDALESYRAISKEQGFQIIQIDNEGFEAEIYLRRKKQLAAIQIRTSQCDDESIVFINVVDADQLGQGLPTPTPTPTE